MLNQIVLDTSEMSFCEKDGAGGEEWGLEGISCSERNQSWFLLRLTRNVSVTTVLRAAYVTRNVLFLLWSSRPYQLSLTTQVSLWKVSDPFG
jgi:hypothetical protein